jgi:hypothetical protein
LLTRHLQRIPRLLRQTIYYLSMPLREALIDFEGLSLSLRILAVLGYVSVFVLLALTLLLDLFRDRLTLVRYYPSVEEIAREIPLPVLIVSSLCFALGWAYILTGATDCRRRVFLPVAGLFALQLFLFLPQGNAMFLWFCAAPPLVVVLVGSYFFTRAQQFWRDFPLVEFFLWGCVLLFFVALFWLSGQSVSDAAKNIGGIVDFISLLNVPLWVFFGLGIVDIAVSVGRTVATTLRRFFPGEILRALTVFFVLVRPAIAILVLALNQLETALGGILFLDAAITTLPLLALIVGLALFRRWNTRSASIITSLSFASLAFILCIFPALNAQEIFDPLGSPLESLGIFPPLLTFVALMAHNVLSFGSAFTDTDGQIIPRSGRVLLLFGFALLVISLTIFSVNVRDATGQLDETFRRATDAFFGLGLAFLGLPYLAWILWRRRDRLAGSEADFEGVEPVFAGLARISGRVWLVVGIVVAVFLCCVICLVGILFFPSPSG